MIIHTPQIRKYTIFKINKTSTYIKIKNHYSLKFTPVKCAIYTSRLKIRIKRQVAFLVIPYSPKAHSDGTRHTGNALILSHLLAIIACTR